MKFKQSEAATPYGFKVNPLYVSIWRNACLPGQIRLPESWDGFCKSVSGSLMPFGASFNFRPIHLIFAMVSACLAVSCTPHGLVCQHSILNGEYCVPPTFFPETVAALGGCFIAGRLRHHHPTDRHPALARQRHQRFCCRTRPSHARYRAPQLREK